MKTVLITGASSGIGREFAMVFARNGYDLILTARNHAALVEVGDAVTALAKPPLLTIPCDLAQADAAEQLVHQLSDENISIDILVNNAGLGNYGQFSEIDWQLEEQLINVNITALVRLTHLLLPAMLARKSGRILNVSSTAAFRPGPFMASYFASKAFVLSFSQALSAECRSHGVTVTALCPGATRSKFAERAGLDASQFLKGKKIAEAAEVARFGFEALMKGKSVAVHGWQNRFLTFLLPFVPRAFLLKVSEGVKRRK